MTAVAKRAPRKASSVAKAPAKKDRSVAKAPAKKARSVAKAPARSEARGGSLSPGVGLSPGEIRARLEAVKAAQAERSLWRFLRDYAWPVLQPGTEFVDNWHIHAICDHLEALSRGDIKRLIVNLPFRMLKSTIVSQAFPAWEWIRAPRLQYLTASYAKDVSTRDAVDSRRIIESNSYQLAWGERFRMTSDQNVKTRYENSKKGSRITTSTESAGTGFGGNRILIDDPLSALEADNVLKRRQSVEWWKGTAATRLNNPKDDAIVLVHQRLNTEDLTGYLLEHEADAGWVHLVLPMRYEPGRSKPTSVGFVDPRTEPGELMAPERLDEATVREMETRLGTYHTRAQLQQDPETRSGVIFDPGLWNFYHVPPEQVYGSMDEVIWSWDLSFKDTLGSDFVAGLCVGRKGADKYLLARRTERLAFSATKAAVLNESVRLPYARKLVAVLVEDKANGPAVISELQGTIAGLTPVSPQGGKVVRANAVHPQHESGNFYLPSPAMKGYEWVNEFVSTFTRFPNVDHDDDVDAWTQAVTWFTSRENFKRPPVAPATGGARVF